MRVAKYLVPLTVALFVPARAFAQASLTGVVRDTSGGVMPGVTVEAASPALIEKVRRPSPTAPACTASSTCVPAPTR